MNKVFKKIRAVFLAVFVALSTVLTTPFAGSIVTNVNAESSSIQSAVFDVIRETTGTDLSDPATWSNWSKVSGSPSYGKGIGNDVNHVVSDPYAGESMDCVRMSMFITGHAIQKASGNPNDYFSTVGYSFNGYGKFEESTNVNEASTGDILAYGTAHLAVALGWKDGELWTIDGSSGYGGWVIHKYRGYASSGGASANFSKLYKVPPMNKKIGVSVKKNSSLPDCTNGNSLYGLSATFGVYTSADGNESTRIATIQTDANGNGSATGISVSPSVNTVYVKELTAPTNYRLSDTSIHAVNVSSGNGSTAFTDEPLNDPAIITLTKVDSEGKENAASLEGAEFTINYYDTLDSTDGRTPTRTWVIKTLHDTTSNAYVAYLDDAHLVSGTPYRNSLGDIVLPLGTITIQETKAPNNYTTDGGYLKANGEQFSANDKMTFQIVNENSMAVIHAGNVFTKKEDAIRGGYKLEKQDWSTGATAEGDASLAGAEFDLYYLGDGTDSNVSIKLDKDGDGLGEGTEYLPSDTTPIEHITVGEDGTYTSSATYLGYGKYKVVETKSPEGYLLTSYDAAYEGLNYLSLLEAKRDMSSTDFLIRQLYYPYRLWMNRVSKQVKTVFFIYSNGDFRLYEYLFNEPEYYNSLQLVKCQRYVIAAGITLTDIQNIIYNIQIEAEPEIPFPQADSMTRVVNLLELLVGNDMSKQDITANYGFDERQTNYYTAAGKYLGLIENYQNQNTKEIVFSLTPLARKILSSSYREKQLELIKCILQHKVFNDVMKAYLLYGEMPERSHIINLMKKDSLYNVNSDSTYSRRASTVSGWLNWIVSLCELE